MASKSERIQTILGHLTRIVECSICKDYMTNPVATKCNHKFCRFCITTFLKTSTSVPCPLCKEPVTKRSLRDQEGLNKIVKHIRELIVAYQEDTGQVFSPPRGTPDASFLPCTPEPIFPKEDLDRPRRQPRRNVKHTKRRDAETSDENKDIESGSNVPESTSRGTCSTAAEKHSSRILNKKTFNQTKTRRSGRISVIESDREEDLLQYLESGEILGISCRTRNSKNVPQSSESHAPYTESIAGEDGPVDAVPEDSRIAADMLTSIPKDQDTNQNSESEIHSSCFKQGSEKANSALSGHGEIKGEFERRDSSLGHFKPKSSKTPIDTGQTTESVMEPNSKIPNSHVSSCITDTSRSKVASNAGKQSDFVLSLTPESEYQLQNDNHSNDELLLFQSQEVKAVAKPQKPKLSIYNKTRSKITPASRNTNRDEAKQVTNSFDKSLDFSTCSNARTYSKSERTNTKKNNRVMNWVDSAAEASRTMSFSPDDPQSDGHSRKSDAAHVHDNFGFDALDSDLEDKISDLTSSRTSESTPTLKDKKRIFKAKQTPATASASKTASTTSSTSGQELKEHVSVPQTSGHGDHNLVVELPSSDPYEFKSSQTPDGKRNAGKAKQRGRRAVKTNNKKQNKNECPRKPAAAPGPALTKKSSRSLERKKACQKHVHFDLPSPEEEMSHLANKIEAAEDHDFLFSTQEAASSFPPENEIQMMEEGFADLEDFETDKSDSMLPASQKSPSCAPECSSVSEDHTSESKMTESLTVVPPTPLVNGIEEKDVKARRAEEETNSKASTQDSVAIVPPTPLISGIVVKETMSKESQSLSFIPPTPVPQTGSNDHHKRGCRSSLKPETVNPDDVSSNPAVKMDDAHGSGDEDSSSTEDLNLTPNELVFEEADLDLQPEEVKKQLSQMSQDRQNSQGEDFSCQNTNINASQTESEIPFDDDTVSGNTNSSQQDVKNSKSKAKNKVKKDTCGSISGSTDKIKFERAPCKDMGTVHIGNPTAGRSDSVDAKTVSSYLDHAYVSTSLDNKETAEQSSSATVVEDSSECVKETECDRTDMRRPESVKNARNRKNRNSKRGSGNKLLNRKVIEIQDSEDPEPKEQLRKDVYMIEDSLDPVVKCDELSNTDQNVGKVEDSEGPESSHDDIRANQGTSKTQHLFGQSSGHDSQNKMDQVVKKVQNLVDPEQKMEKTVNSAEKIVIVDSQASTLPNSVAAEAIPDSRPSLNPLVDEQTLPPDEVLTNEDEAEDETEIAEICPESFDARNSLNKGLPSVEGSQIAPSIESLSILEEFNCKEPKNNQSRQNKRHRNGELVSLEISGESCPREISSAPTITLESSEDELLAVRRPKRKCFSLEGSPLQSRVKPAPEQLKRRLRPSSRRFDLQEETAVDDQKKVTGKGQEKSFSDSDSEPDSSEPTSSVKKRVKAVRGLASRKGAKHVSTSSLKSSGFFEDLVETKEQSPKPDKDITLQKASQRSSGRLSSTGTECVGPSQDEENRSLAGKKQILLRDERHSDDDDDLTFEVDTKVKKTPGKKMKLKVDKMNVERKKSTEEVDVIMESEEEPPTSESEDEVISSRNRMTVDDTRALSPTDVIDEEQTIGDVEIADDFVEAADEDAEVIGDGPEIHQGQMPADEGPGDVPEAHDDFASHEIEDFGGAQNASSDSDEEFVLCDNDLIIRKADMPEPMEDLYGNLSQTSTSKDGDSQRRKQDDDESDEAPIRRKKRSSAAVISDSDSDEYDSSAEAQNLTSSSAFSSQSEILTTQQQGKLEKDVEEMRKEIKRLEALKQGIQENSGTDSAEEKTTEINPRSSKTLKKYDASDISLSPSPRSPSPPPGANVSATFANKKEKKVVEVFEIIEKVKSSCKSKLKGSRPLRKEERENISREITQKSDNNESDLPCSNSPLVLDRRIKKEKTEGRGVLSPISSGNKARARKQEIVLITSGLGREQAASVQQFVEMTGSSFLPRFSKPVTHVIVRRAEDEDDQICDRTLKYFQGIVAKCWILSFDWIRDSFVAGTILQEDKYEIIGDTVSGSDHHGPRLSRMSTKKLFSLFTFSCIGVSDDMTREDMSQLLELGGGTIADDPFDLGQMKAENRLIIRCLDTETEPATKSEVEYFNSIYKHFKLVTVSREWVLDSIGCFKVQPLQGYVLNSVTNIILPF